MECPDCLSVFQVIGEALNSPIDTTEFLELAGRKLSESYGLKGCQFRLVDRETRTLEPVAAWGLSQEFLGKGPVDMDKSGGEALRGETVMVADCATDPRVQYPDAFKAEGIRSMLTVPMSSRGQVIGVLRLFSAGKREFSEAELDVIRVVASFCSGAVLHNMFHRILAKVTTTVRSSLQLDTVLAAIARTTADELRAKGCTIRLADHQGLRLDLKAAHGLSDTYLEATRESFGEALRQALAGTCTQVLEVTRDARVLNCEAAEAEGIASALFVPLVVHDRTIGVLSVYTHLPWQFSDDEVYLLTAIAEQCALAIRNAQMYEAVRHRYDMLMEDFHRWFDHVTYAPGPQPAAEQDA